MKSFTASCPQNYAELHDKIKECLAWAIVPSALIDNDQPNDPTAMTMINSTYSFILESLPMLLQNLADEEGGSALARQADAMGRVEQWLAKGLEDRALVMKFAGR